MHVRILACTTIPTSNAYLGALVLDYPHFERAFAVRARQVILGTQIEQHSLHVEFVRVYFPDIQRFVLAEHLGTVKIRVIG